MEYVLMMQSHCEAHGAKHKFLHEMAFREDQLRGMYGL